MNVAASLGLICLVTEAFTHPLPFLKGDHLMNSGNAGPKTLRKQPSYIINENELRSYRLAYSWCLEYKYCSFFKQPNEMSLDDLKYHMCQPIREVKKLYKLKSQSCELTKDLISIMSQPRCSREDEDTCDSNCKKWKRWIPLGSLLWRTMPVTFTLKTPLQSSSFPVEDQKAIAQFCAKLWASNSGLKMRWLDRPHAANIEIQFEYIDGPWYKVGLALSPNPSGSSHLKLDSAERWKRNHTAVGQGWNKGVSLQWAMCHEMGHNLGLGHSGDSTAIMYAQGVGQDDGQLSWDDKRGIQALYGFPTQRYS